jgi:cell division protein ZipA
MDPDLVRLLLVILGVLLVAGIYLWDRYKRAATSRPPRRVRPDDDAPIETFTLEEPDAVADGAREELVPAEPVAAPEPRPSPRQQEPPAPPPVVEGPAAAPRRAKARESEAAAPGDDWRVADRDPQFSMDLRFDAHGDGGDPDAEPALPDGVAPMIIVINLAAHADAFSGPAIVSACARVGLSQGDMSIYHHRDAGSGKVSFSMASMVEPGRFPIDDMQGFTTPGLTLFTQLPGPRDGLSVYNEMLATAERLAALLKGELQDERHNKLTRQMQEHTRASIVEYGRRLQLARSQR